MNSINDKVAIVTGASRGIGKEIAKILASRGIRVVINFNNSEKEAYSIVEEIKIQNGMAEAIQADVSKKHEVDNLIEKALNIFGRIDILVNNAGITRDRTFGKITEEDWKNVIDVNLNSVFNTTNAVLSQMIEQKFGRIINISSVIGQSGGFGQTNYSAAKAGLIGFTKSLALETAKHNITVNAVCPGFIETDMVSEIPQNVLAQIIEKIPQRRLGQQSEIANAVYFLVTQGDYITGQQININGGLYM